jgi:hypothetical protein
MDKERNMERKYGWAAVLERGEQTLKDSKERGDSPEHIAELERVIAETRQRVEDGEAFPNIDPFLGDWEKVMGEEEEG